MKVQPVGLSPNTSPCASAIGNTASAAIGQIVAMNVATSMSRRKYRVDTMNASTGTWRRRRTRSPDRRIAAAGALNNTMATPPNARVRRRAPMGRCTR